MEWIRLLAAVYGRRILCALVLVASAQAAPLWGQSWLDTIPAPLAQHDIAPISAVLGNAPAVFANLGPGEETDDRCQCGAPVECTCGACGACCSCSGGWLHAAGGWIAPWDGTLELGLNGAEGNSQNANFFFGFDTKREYATGSFLFDLDYFYQTADSVVTSNRLVALSRYERLLRGGPLKWYLEGFYEYDQLRDYPARVSASTGLSTPLIETERCSLDGRAGLSGSKKIDAADDDWRPELQLGADYEVKLTERQRFFGFVDYYPDVSDFGTYRLNFKLAWEALLEDEWGLALRASLVNWYDSQPGPGTKANDLYYTLALVWGY